MANPEHLAILKQRVEVWNGWREAQPGTYPDLSRADLKGMNLKEADLAGCGLFEADLVQADLTGADLTEAVLIFAPTCPGSTRINDIEGSQSCCC
jgi:hypothetical protein